MTIGRWSARPGCVLLCTVAVVLGGFAGNARAANNTSKTEHISVLIPAAATSWALPYVALQDGFFQHEGLDVTISVAGNGPLAVQAILGGSADVGLDVLNLTLQAAAQGQNLVNLGEIFNTFDGQLILSKAAMGKHGITLKQPLAKRMAEMKGMTIADLGPASGTDILLRYLLKQGGLNPDKDVTITSIKDGSATLAALQHGAIDGFLRAAPDTSAAVASGLGVSVADFTKKDTPGLPGVLAGTLFVKGDYLNAHRPALKRFMKALELAAAYMYSNEKTVIAQQRAQWADLPYSVYTTAMHFDIELDGRTIRPVTQRDVNTNLGFVTPASIRTKITFGNVVDNSLLTPIRFMYCKGKAATSKKVVKWCIRK